VQQKHYDRATNAHFRPNKPRGATGKSLIVLNPRLSLNQRSPCSSRGASAKQKRPLSNVFVRSWLRTQRILVRRCLWSDAAPRRIATYLFFALHSMQVLRGGRTRDPGNEARADDTDQGERLGGVHAVLYPPTIAALKRGEVGGGGFGIKVGIKHAGRNGKVLVRQRIIAGFDPSRPSQFSHASKLPEAAAQRQARNRRMSIRTWTAPARRRPARSCACCSALPSESAAPGAIHTRRRSSSLPCRPRITT